MITKTAKLDTADRRILRVLQRDSSLPQRDLADRVGLSQAACWKRLRALRESGLIASETLRIDPVKVGLSLTVFVLVRTRHHARDWLAVFRDAVMGLPNVIDFYRIAGEYDYILKIVAEDMNAFDGIYRQLIDRVELDAVTSYVTMESIANNRDLPL